MSRPSLQIPAPPTSFVGRDHDLARLRERCAKGARLVTILGPPGIGKSRLALRHAELVRDAFREGGGIWIADLTEARRPEDVAQAVLRARPGVLNVEGVSGDPIDRVGRALAMVGKALLVLDNCEGGVRAIAETLARWMALAPELRFIATSRERLGLTAEFLHELGPLRLPPSSAEAAESEAVQLFIERARAVQSDFALTPANADALCQVVRELDGIPLAVELAATRMAVLTPSDLMQRLPRRFELLSQTHRDVSGRQRTLKAAIDSSYATLDEAERSALRQAAVFRGGFSLDAAEAVIRPRGRRAPAVVDLLQALREHSLVHTFAATQVPEEARFGLYLSIRDYAAQRLQAEGELDAVTERHASYYLGYARRWSGELSRGRFVEAVRRIALELDNLRAVHRRLVSGDGRTRQRAAQSVLLCEALEPLLSGSGSATLELMANASLETRKLDPATRALALRIRGDARRALGRLEAAAKDQEASLALGKRLRDVRLQAKALASLGATRQLQGDLARSLEALQRAIPLLGRKREKAWEARAQILLSNLRLVIGDVVEAEQRALRAIELAGEAGDEAQRKYALGTRGLVYLARRRTREARPLLEQAIRYFREAGNTNHEGTFWVYLGILALDEGERDAAVDALGRAVRRLGSAGNRRGEGMAQGVLGNALHEQGRLPEALTQYEEAIRVLHAAGDRRAEALFSASAAAIHCARGNLGDAEALVRRARGLLRDTDPGDVLRTTVELYAANLGLGRASRPGDRAPAEAAREELRQQAQALQAVTVKGLPVLETSMHARVAYRILTRALEDERWSQAGAASASTEPRGLVLARDGRWCALPDGKQIVFQRARALRLILLRLFEERLAHPGRALTVQELFESGWPGDRVAESSAENRVYVGLSRLRKAGLQGLVVSRDDGFLLDPDVPARWRHAID